MNGINFMRRESESIDRKDFDERFPMVATTDVSRWILNNIGRVRIVPEGSGRTESRGYLGHSTMESECLITAMECPMLYSILSMTKRR